MSPVPNQSTLEEQLGSKPIIVSGEAKCSEVEEAEST